MIVDENANLINNIKSFQFSVIVKFVLPATKVNPIKSLVK